MFIKDENYFKIKEFERNNITAFFTRKSFFERNTLKDLLPKNKIFISAYQKHTDVVKDISKTENRDYFEGVDGFITKRDDVVLVTKHADCLPIFFYDKKEKVIGMVHSGWKGSFQEIGLKTLNLMEKNYNSLRKNIIIGLGIGISCEKYEVGDEFYENFKSKFSYEIIKKSFKSYDGRKHFDNCEFNKLNFISNGILKKNIIVSKECTFEGDFFSFRRDKNKERNYAVIYFNKKSLVI
ncbi:peptidoglycan editing factor PgeF [Fusobacterium sp. MFO224]|uniref:peptidoglycan editing factor PgeF n=1 Tax=Fusobacterium sp. MFO224 TaxID=3378070 RepID=UPI0038528338